jgi:RNA polymerase sigma factor (sigma-70 family)
MSLRYSSVAEARAAVVLAAIDHAVHPLRAILDADGLSELGSLLDDALATHPCMRLLASRAAREAYAPFAPKLKAAAKKPGEDDPDEGDDHGELDEAPVTAIAQREKPPPELPGGVSIDDPKLLALARPLLEGLAKKLAPSNKHKRKELVSEGWMVVVETRSEYDARKSKYDSFLWCRAHARMMNFLKRASNRRERPASSVYLEDAHAPKKGDEDASAKLFAATDAAAASFMLGYLRPNDDDPERAVIRARERADVVASIEKLDELERGVIRIVYYERRTLEFAAKELGVSLSTARRTHERALASLRAILDGGPGPTKILSLAAARAKKRART